MAENQKTISLMDKLKKVKHLVLNFVGLTYSQTQDGKLVAILELEDPIPMVRSSIEHDNGQGGKSPIILEDVTELKIHEDNFVDAIQFNEEDNYGSYEGDELLLDVSQQGQAWLVKTQYAVSGRAFGQKQKSERLQKLVTGRKQVASTEKPMITGG